MVEVHFARVAPVVGQYLRQARVAVVGLPQAAPLVTHLAACGVGRWMWEVVVTACPLTKSRVLGITASKTRK